MSSKLIRIPDKSRAYNFGGQQIDIYDFGIKIPNRVVTFSEKNTKINNAIEHKINTAPLGLARVVEIFKAMELSRQFDFLKCKENFTLLNDKEKAFFDWRPEHLSQQEAPIVKELIEPYLPNNYLDKFLN